MLVLSLFPGIGLLDKAFELEGFCVVRGPDVLWGGDIREFHPLPGRFDGVIGGPPCQKFSNIRALLKSTGRDTKAVNLIPEFCRCVAQASPMWFLMENVRTADSPTVPGYEVRDYVVQDCDVGGDTNRVRRFWFGTPDGRELQIKKVARSSILPVAPTVVAGHGAVMSHERGNTTLAEICELQGLPATFVDNMPFTAHGKRKVIGNGVPLPMGRAIARAVRESLTPEPTQ